MSGPQYRPMEEEINMQPANREIVSGEPGSPPQRPQPHPRTGYKADFDYRTGMRVWQGRDRDR